jgi:2-octaprenylphenol hydroxylase
MYRGHWNMHNRFDVMIAGGGMVGGALACALGETGFSVAIIERTPPAGDWPADEVDLRVSALTRASQRMLQRLGAWSRMQEMRVSPYREMLVWDARGGKIHFDAADIGEPDLGHIVENRVTQLALWERLTQLQTVSRFTPDRVKGFRHQPQEGMKVELESGATISGRLLVAAEGASSPIRESAGITSSGWAYDQHAIVATIEVEKYHDEVARQRFMPAGPLAFLPIDDGRCSIVWSTSPDHAERLMGQDETNFCEELTRISARMLGRVTGVGPRALFPLRLRNADRYVLPGLALVGDAAHGIHPLAGQGVNLGFLDAATLFDVLREAREHRRDLGSMATLRRYERARKTEDMAMLGVMDLFKRTFSNDNLALALIRNLGLEIADRSGPLKHHLARRALGVMGGVMGRLPSLAEPGSNWPGEPRREKNER